MPVYNTSFKAPSGANYEISYDRTGTWFALDWNDEVGCPVFCRDLTIENFNPSCCEDGDYEALNSKIREIFELTVGISVN